MGKRNEYRIYGVDSDGLAANEPDPLPNAMVRRLITAIGYQVGPPESQVCQHGNGCCWPWRYQCGGILVCAWCGWEF